MQHIPAAVGGQQWEKNFLSPHLQKYALNESKNELIYYIDIHRVFILTHSHKTDLN